MARRDKDFYPTTPSCAWALRLWMDEHVGEVLPGGLDYHDVPFFAPCAGYGAIIRALQPMVPTWIGWDIDKRFREPLEEVCVEVDIRDSISDYMNWPAAPIIDNPPFSHCDTFCRRVVEHVRRTDQTAIILTRGQWLDESGKRDLRQQFPPAWELRTGWRPSFTADGGADNSTYCWWVWRSDFPKVTQKVWLERPTNVPTSLKYLQKIYMGMGDQPDLFADTETP